MLRYFRERSKRRKKGLRLREIREGRAVLRSLPATVNIEFSSRCNVWPPCTYCVGKHAPGYQEQPPISDRELKPYWKYLLGAERVNDTTYGEPLMNPQIHELIDRMGKAGVEFGFTSNGLLLTEKKARLLAKHGEHVHMCISFNAATKETYYLHQGKDFNKLLKNVEKFIEVCRETRPEQPPPLILSFIVMRSNQHEVMDFIRLGRRLGVKGVLLRHLFEMGEDNFKAEVFGQHFHYGRERLTFAEYKAIEEQVRATDEFKDGRMFIQFAWSGNDSFIKQQSEPGVDIPCLFPWKFLCIRPLHGFYTPCVYIKKGIAKTNETVGQVWNGEVMRELRTSLAKGEVPTYCCEHSDFCPLVMEKREREKAAAPIGERKIALPVLAG